MIEKDGRCRRCQYNEWKILAWRNKRLLYLECRRCGNGITLITFEV